MGHTACAWVRCSVNKSSALCRKASPAQKPLSPTQALHLLAGKQPEWVLETRLPLWLVKGYEEQLRRNFAAAAASAARQAARGERRLYHLLQPQQALPAIRGTCGDALRAAEAALEDEARARAAEAEAARRAVVAAAESCAVCGQGWGQEVLKDALWMSCDICNRWFHGSCAGANQDMLDLLEDEDHWECDQCWQTRCVALLPPAEAHRVFSGPDPCPC